MNTHYQRRSGRPDRLAVFDIETLAPPVPDGGFPPWPLHSIVVASVLQCDFERYGQWRFNLESVTFEDDPAVAIERVSYLLENRTAISYNGRGFDAPVLAACAMRHRKLDLRGIAEIWRSHRFAGTHIDLADVVSGFGAARGGSLERLGQALGFPVKLDAHGSEVGEMMAAGRLADVVRYCESDCCATACLYALVHGLRENEPEYGASLIDQLGRWVRSQQLGHLDAFARIEGAETLQRLSLAGIVVEGLKSLDLREHMLWVTHEPGSSGLTSPTSSDFPA